MEECWNLKKQINTTNLLPFGTVVPNFRPERRRRGRWCSSTAMGMEGCSPLLLNVVFFLGFRMSRHGKEVQVIACAERGLALVQEGGVKSLVVDELKKRIRFGR